MTNSDLVQRKLWFVVNGYHNAHGKFTLAWSCKRGGIVSPCVAATRSPAGVGDTWAPIA